ncbi:MAG: chromosome segregation protein SMC [Alphaproteobacteria bacterium]|nr:chromosome segregation protein SMC [Alphaproteobacteria bacterium]
MVQFIKLRLSGFKSFIDSTEIMIESGLTGIVGPNGCGKSNIVDALRWVMGEISAKQMRGGEMNDVIFSGTANRPARNIAEVSVFLDNSKRKAPTAFNDDDELEIIRRIERDQGSAYTVNGQEVRARDVQLLFADSATGARSTALVSQGRIGALISAKPTDRRAVLEEAAGITGLHSRRHEAELRLRGAETNLERLDDVLLTLEEQGRGLKRQARQASRYRNIGDQIRRQEAMLFHQRWRAAGEDMDAAHEKLGEGEVRVTALSRIVAAATTKKTQAAADLPKLRRDEAEAASALQRLLLARDGLDAEEERLTQARQDCESRLAQIAGDIEREKILSQDAATALARCEEERAAINDAQQGEEAAQREALEKVEAVASEVAELENRLTSLTEQVAASEGRRAGLERQIAEIDKRLARNTERIAEVAQQHEALDSDAGNSAQTAQLRETEAAVTAGQAGLEELRANAEKAEKKLATTRAADEKAREALATAEADNARLRAEEETLTTLLATSEAGDGTPLMDEITVESGYEAALGAALGEDLDAPADEDAPMRWRTLPPYEDTAALPGGIEPLSTFVTAPKVLSRRLALTGVVTGDAQGRDLAATLKPGQRLVSRDGGLWRWDGFTVDSGAETAAATRLGQRNRLGEIRSHKDAAENKLAGIRARAGEARDQARAALEAERQAQEALRRAYANHHTAQDDHATAVHKAAEAKSRIAGLREADQRLRAERVEAEAERETAQEALTAQEDMSASSREMEQLRKETGERRALLIESRSAHDQLNREAAQRRDRLAAIAAEIKTWDARSQAATHQISELQERQQSANAERDQFDARPQEIATQRAILQDQIDKAEAARAKAAGVLAQAEERLAEIEHLLKVEETNLAEARESRVRAEAVVEQAQQALDSLAERISERLECAPDKALETANIPPDDDLPEPEAVEKKLERLLRERDTMGPVNLRAEEEARGIEEQIATLQSEREDLVAAISRLRQGIASLNREGRERLLAAFSEVDTHFQELFVRLFGGGRAHMELVDSNDPLEAGLEIFASPPGKKLQVLSLLSGGEKALTALALLFAVFLTNPAPICVLDEVDAPLDDANVDRFCDLIEEIAHKSDTRFVVVTHHRLTMARVDRLFGVTMMERGVSQIVSVDLQRAERLRAAS